MDCLVIQHVPFEDLGTFLPVLEKHGYAPRYFHAGLGLPSESAFLSAPLAIVMGGPIGANDEALYPFLADELAMVRARADAMLPTLGVCLGAQLMAKAMGARVYPNNQKEIGFSQLTMAQGGLFSPLARLKGVPVLHWHGDTFDIPEGAELLASTPATRNQAFRAGDALLALQFHPEADALTIEQWLIGHACELGAAGIDPGSVREDALRHGDALKEASALMLEDWLRALGD
ncbi:MAG: glutamine amidotransferase [Deltaproteobacteria bacterium]|jgi:GMP synthase (glutamine-hydrolysing)|nr:glutamine amidotransferase [Deltaproteobacteria bacterium]